MTPDTIVWMNIERSIIKPPLILLPTCSTSQLHHRRTDQDLPLELFFIIRMADPSDEKNPILLLEMNLLSLVFGYEFLKFYKKRGNRSKGRRTQAFKYECPHFVQ